MRDLNGEPVLRISTRYTAVDWHRLTFESEEDWHQAIDIFKERVKERFLDPISRIEDCPYAGFAVLALDCLLVEMLQQFREGVNRTPAGKSNLYFTRFLTETGFGAMFTKKMAELFYRQIRCGILHQAEVRGKSKVLIQDGLPLVTYTDDQSGLVVNRKAFHLQLLREFDDFVGQLQDPSSAELRKKFRKKMVSLCRVACEIV